jgi:hypothetical protein
MMEEIMATTTIKRGGRRDSSRVAAGQGYEVNYFARKHGISTQKARELIRMVGNNRAKLEQAIARLKD